MFRPTYTAIFRKSYKLIKRNVFQEETSPLQTINMIIFKAMFCIYLRIDSDLCHLQHKLIGFYNRDEKCLQRGTDWVFK